MSGPTTTSASGFVCKFVALETYFHDLRVEVLMSAKDGKLTVEELHTMKDKLQAVELSVIQTRRLLLIAEEELRQRAGE